MSLIVQRSATDSDLYVCVVDREAGALGVQPAEMTWEVFHLNLLCGCCGDYLPLIFLCSFGRNVSPVLLLHRQDDS